MGQSGFDIMDNDQAMDVYYKYFERYNAGKSTEEINRWFEENNAFEFQNKTVEDCSHFWLGLAFAQWETKALTPFVFERVSEIVNWDTEKDDWGENYPQRKKLLQKFLARISKEKATAKKPVKQKLFKAVFEKGDVVTYPIYDLETKSLTDTWGLSVCVESTQGLEKSATSLFVTSGVEKAGPVTMEEFGAAYALAGHGNDKGFSWKGMSNNTDLEPIDKIRKIGKVDVARSFCMSSYPGNFNWYFTYRYDFVRGGKHNTIFRLPEVISVPDSPYSKWGERIVELQNLKYDDPKKNDPETYRDIADFLVELRTKNEAVFRNEFTRFIADYLFTPVDKVENIFFSIAKSAGRDIELFR